MNKLNVKFNDVELGFWGINIVVDILDTSNKDYMLRELYPYSRNVADSIEKIMSGCVADKDRNDRYFIEEFVFKLLTDNDIADLPGFWCYVPGTEETISRASKIASVARRACLVGGMIS